MCMRSGSHAKPGNGGRGIALSQWLPGQLDKGLTRGGVDFAEIEHIGETDENRIAAVDVFGLLPRTSVGVSEQHGVTSGDRLAVGQGHDRPATATTLDFRDPLFARREGSHEGLARVKGLRPTPLSSLALWSRRRSHVVIIGETEGAAGTVPLSLR
jgi:hypothetical protein